MLDKVLFIVGRVPRIEKVPLKEKKEFVISVIVMPPLLYFFVSITEYPLFPISINPLYFTEPKE